VRFSEDQAEAYDAVAELLLRAGIDLINGDVRPAPADSPQMIAVLGKAGSGKTMLLARLGDDLAAAGVVPITGDYEGRVRPDQRTLAILAPTNKAAGVLRTRGVAATTIHRILYTPVYDPEYARIADWLTGSAERPQVAGLTDAALDRAAEFYRANTSIPGALAMAGLRGSDFIIGWKRREDPLDVGFIDEASMLDDNQLSDLNDTFSTLVLFGDPAQLAPVGQAGTMAFDRLGARPFCAVHVPRWARPALWRLTGWPPAANSL